MEVNNTQRVIKLCIVILSCILSFVIRLFSNVINEPIIHEFDPHFNWRCTQFIDKHGLYEFLGWFDNISWYPQGRPVGETSYPGLMYTVAIIKWSLQKVHIMIPLLQICVHMGPIFSVFTTLLAYLLGQLLIDSSLGCVFAAITAFIPGLLSRSVAGSFDYECIALFILVLALYTFAYSLKTGSILAAVFSAFAYGYMCLTWGGYVFISNCIPLFAAGLIVLGRYSWRLHISYSVWAVVGTLLAASVPFIGDKVLRKPEHFASVGLFFVMQLWGLFTYFNKYLSPSTFNTICVSSALSIPVFFFFVITIGMSTGLVGGFSGRLMQMFDPSYAAKNIPIIASVAEHQQSTWAAYFMDCGFFIILFPIGCYFILKHQTNDSQSEASFLILIYGLSTMYFASIMVRLVLVFTPACVFISGIAIHHLLTASFKSKISLNTLVIITLFCICIMTEYHSVWFACYSYSGDHIHFPVHTKNGQETSDDYREAYRWLWENTDKNHRVMSWWDYGYQITSMGGRGCHADGNTNNFTHIGIIGMTMSSPEQVSWRIARMMDADYLLIVFGGASGYDGDDINKFLWMPKIANQTFHNISGEMYYTTMGPIVGQHQTDNMTNSMMFKMCYYQFKNYQLHKSVPKGFDIARRAQINKGIDHIKFSHFEEAFTSKNWIIRIYRVLRDPNWDRVY